MDPVTAIVAAILAGASSAAGDIVKDEVKSAYVALKERLRSAFRKDERLEPAVRLAEKMPDDDDAVAILHGALAAAGADEDEELQRLAQEVLKAAKGKPIYRNVVEAAEQARVRNSGIRMAAAVDADVVNEVRAGRGAEIDDSGISIG